MSVEAQSPAVILVAAVFLGSATVAACGFLAGMSAVADPEYAARMTRWGVTGVFVSFVAACALIPS